MYKCWFNTKTDLNSQVSYKEIQDLCESCSNNLHSLLGISDCSPNALQIMFETELCVKHLINKVALSAYTVMVEIDGQYVRISVKHITKIPKLKIIALSGYNNSGIIFTPDIAYENALHNGVPISNSYIFQI